MTDETKPSIDCQDIEEQMAEILDGTASEAIYDHIADCDRCRDARHDAERARELVLDSSRDYRAPEDLEERVMSLVDGESTQTRESQRPTTPTDPPEFERPTTPTDAPPADEATGGPSAVQQRNPWVGATILGAALAAAAAVLVLLQGNPKETAEASAGWSAKVLAIASVGDAKGAGLSACDSNGSRCEALSTDQKVPKGSLLVTDERTRAQLKLSDGSQVVLDRTTRLALSDRAERRAKLQAGALVADVAHLQGERAHFELPRGEIEVLGTKFALRASDEATTVDVSRGSVVLADAKGNRVSVRAGEQGRLLSGAAPYVSSAFALGEALAWSEFQRSDSADYVARGLGELKAKKPSSDQELSSAVTLTSHKVKVRISGAVARTEIDETFTNHTDDVLEGIYRFPIPPDAQIERLALEVDGKLEEGAFVDRERAAAIWRGAIVNAAPKRKQQIRDEIVWVPGPWKDPALLEWQRGGRFELRIFPIPKRGARRVVLAYTQVLKPTGGFRRYNYPLPHDPGGTTKIDSFEVDVQVRGHDPKLGVRSAGYALAATRQSNVEQLRFSERGFVPRGDLILEYALPNRDAELTAWTYLPDVEQARAKEPSENGNAYVALELRPKLPRHSENTRRTLAFVVDSSRSMFGESYRRASRVVVKTIRELDPNDRFTLLACDTECRVLPGGPKVSGPEAALEAKRFLDEIVPEGASDLAAAVSSARKAAGEEAGRELRVVYLGDGTPTVGPIRPVFLTRAVEKAIPAGSGTVSAVAVGADSDTDALAALARGGGGAVLPFVPGQSTVEAAYAVLGAVYGSALRDVHVELPSGLVEVAPEKVDTIVAGSEAMLVARMTTDRLEGHLVLKGKLGQQTFEQRYPLKLTLSEGKGNAFVPRLFAATRIKDLERASEPQAKKEAIRLSSEFDVASRYTSLLVLESPAMFRAFGLDNTRNRHEFSGEEETETWTSAGIEDLADDESADALGMLAGKGADLGVGLGSIGSAYGTGGQSLAPGDFGASASSAPAPAAEPKASSKKMKPPPRSPSARGDLRIADELRQEPPPPPGRRRRMIPMRRIWERKGSIHPDETRPKAVNATSLRDAERELESHPNRRQAVKRLYVLRALAGELEQASKLAERWSEKEPLDPEALTARADMAARRGQRELAIRILGSVVDVRPGDIGAQRRLARLHRWAGRPELGCRHALALAQLRGDDGAELARAVHCGRRTGQSQLVEDLLAGATERVRKASERELKQLEKATDELSGDLRLEAGWTGGDNDLDLALLHPDGHRVSWLGAPTHSVITATDVLSTSREGLALRGAKPGEYLIEVVRSAGSGPVSGNVTVSAAGSKKTISFSLDSTNKTIGLVKIAMRPRLVPLNQPLVQGL